MKYILTVLVLVELVSQVALASPRRVRDFSREQSAQRSEARIAIDMQQDAFAREQNQEAEVIREATGASARRPTGVHREMTMSEYRNQLEASLERLDADEFMDPVEKERKKEAIYEALYQSRRSTFADPPSPLGHGAGPGGERYQAPVDLGAVWDLLFDTDSAPNSTDSDTDSSP